MEVERKQEGCWKNTGRIPQGCSEEAARKPVEDKRGRTFAGTTSVLFGMEKIIS
jgi:hypothetical protein